MPKIRVLDKQIAELIAAGEVVERPSSVIKELVENAVDSGASVVTVEIRRGGVSFMRVTDNGCGIQREDVPTAFLRHATSKVVNEDDLYAISTLGFRGEALASISAVAHVELLTRARGEALGTRYVCGGGEEPQMDDAGCPEGTTILVRDLFYNTPARMKFLKKDVTEGNAVSGILDKMALSHPEVSFRLIRDGKETLHTPGDNKLSSAIYSVFGKEFYQTLIPVDYELNHIKVQGFVSAPTGARANRSMQNFFINGRFIKSRTAAAAMEEACKGAVMVGKYPACVLHLSLSFSAVDVNVHPAKLEVRFVNERPIFDAVYYAVKSALAQKDKRKVMTFSKPPIVPTAPVEKAPQLQFQSSSRPKVETPQEKPLKKEFGLTMADSKPAASSSLPGENRFAGYLDKILDTPVVPDVAPEKKKPVVQETEEKKIPIPQIHVPAAKEAKNTVSVEEKKAPVFVYPEEKKEEALPIPFAEVSVSEEPKKEEAAESVSREEAFTFAPDYHSKVLGEAFGTYLIVEYTADSLMLIDKHAAHERLLYEKLRSQNNGGEAQTLLEPVSVTLDKDEYSAVLDHLDQLDQMGFQVEDFGIGTVLVRSAPLLLDGSDAAEAIMEIAGYLASYRTDLTPEKLDWVYHNVACRAAIKAGDPTSAEELISLARELEKNPQVRYCPHGRPVFILIRKRDIEKQFGRI
jgi:DNA mismatch repair protein MutL